MFFIGLLSIGEGSRKTEKAYFGKLRADEERFKSLEQVLSCHTKYSGAEGLGGGRSGEKGGSG